MRLDTVGVVVKDNAYSEGGLEIDFRAGQIGRSVANGSPPLQRFFGTVLPMRYKGVEIILLPVTRFGIIP